jgi:3-dehydroquinate dehydratase II
MKIYVINGANLNLMGRCQTEKFGQTTLEDIERGLRSEVEGEGIQIIFHQSNYEGELIETVHKAYFDKAAGIIINPGGYRHSSVGLAEAIQAVRVPTVEVHITPIGSKEFHHETRLSGLTLAQICSQADSGYKKALKTLLKHLDRVKADTAT